MPLALLPAALSFLGKNWKLLALAGLVLAVLGYVEANRLTITHLRSQVAAYRRSNDQLHAANVSEHATVQRLLGLNAADQRVCAAAEGAAQVNLSIAKREAHAAQVRAANYGSILHAIQSAPADPAPVSPVVRDAVASLWDGAQAGDR